MNKFLDIDKVVIVFAMLIFIPPLVSGFILSIYISGIIVDEKTEKLYGIANTLDKLFDSDYNTIIKKYGMDNASKDEKILILSKELSPISDMVVSGFHDTGIGYYNKELDAIITYAPSEKMNWTIGMPISKNHYGRYAMESMQWISYRGKELVWGDGIAVFYPIIRDNKAIGYIWAVELYGTINKQLFPIYLTIAIVVSIIIGFGIAGLSIFIFKRDNKYFINNLNEYFKNISIDDTIRLPYAKGIYGEINNTINTLVDKLVMQKEIETRMLKAENMLVGSFITLGIAHEIKNPLMSIKGYSDLIKESSHDNLFISKYARIISDETNRINNLIGNLLSISKKSDIINEKYSINHLIQESISLLKPNFRKHNIKYTFKSNKDYRIVCDNNRFKQIMLNMLLNSLSSFDDNSKDKRIEIYLEEKDGILTVNIKDNGCGIPNDKLTDIFQPFYTTKSNSTGLGLFIVKDFIDSMNWQLEVASEEHAYTCFSIIIPLHK